MASLDLKGHPVERPGLPRGNRRELEGRARIPVAQTMIEAQHRRAARSPYDLELAGVRKMPERNRLEARLEAFEARQSVTDPVPVRSERPRVVDPMSPRMARVVAGRADGQPSSPPPPLASRLLRSRGTGEE